MKNQKRILLLLFVFAFRLAAKGQDSLHLNLQQAVQIGLDSSKKMQLAKIKIQETLNQTMQAKDRQLPEAKVSFMGSEAFIPTRRLQIKGLMPEAMELPGHSTVYLGTLSINEVIFAGHKMRYAKESARLLQKIARLNKTNDRQGVIMGIIQSYINLYKIDQNIKVIRKNIKDIDKKLKETQQFKSQGLATLNDVLRFQLEKSQTQLTLVDLENNRAVANYSLITLLGLSDHTTLKINAGEDLVDLKIQKPSPGMLNHFMQKALQERKDLQVYAVRKKVNQTKIKSIKANKLPVFGAGVNTYYLNPNSGFFPPAHGFLVPVTIGLNLSWNISSLYTNKHKVSEAEIQSRKIKIAKEAEADRIRIAVNKSYHAYLQSFQRIKVLKTAVTQARENDRIMELKYQNQLVTVTDRIDAQTLFYKSMIELGLAKADAAISHYKLLEAAGLLKAHF